MKVKEAYNNNKLKEALKDRDTIYNSILSGANIYKYTDEELKKLDNLKKLSPFQRDLLYLSSQQSVYEVADLYNVSATYLYKKLREIRAILDE